MNPKQKAIDLARAATGDDEITVAGDFQPKGMTWKRGLGTAAGAAVGGAVSGGNEWAQAAGAAGGYAAGTLSSATKGVPPVVVLAASPTKLYVLATTHGQSMILAKQLELLDTVDRRNMTVTIKNRIETRTIVIEDEATGHEYGLEGLKLGFHHMNDLLNLLQHSDESESVAGADEGLQPA